MSATTQAYDRRLAAILAADVVGYSRLTEVDEEGTHARLKALREEFIEPTLERYNGRTVKLTGDGALVEFPSVVQAAQCAVDVQRGMAERNAGVPDHQRLDFRIGINLGDVIIEGDDIYGGGVNVAARLEGLADPGGILISGTAYDQVEGRLGCGLEFLGEKEVKNIERPVRVYRLRLDQAPAGKIGHRGRRAAGWKRVTAAAAALAAVIAGGALWSFYPRPEPPAQAASDQSAPLKLPSKPSIAVLPFANLNNDPDQDLFIDGLTNDIITDLSKFSDLFVIAANSTFRYKGEAVDVQEVGRDLGVRYVLEGSVQRADDTLRINAQLIDATTGVHVWAERYDREAKDFFAVQNEITREVVGVIYPLAEGRGRLKNEELDRIGRTPTENLEAYDYFLQAMYYMDRYTKEDNLRARKLFEKAVQLDSSYARALSKNTWTYLLEYWNGWTDAPEQALQRGIEVAQRALAADPNEPWAHYAIASAYLIQKKHDLAVGAFQRAYALNPNDATILNEMGWTLALAGRPEEGIPLMREAINLNPYPPDWYLANLADGYLVDHRHEDMITTLEKISQPYSNVYRRLAVGYAHLDRLEEAKAALAKYRELEPQASIERLAETMPYKRQEDLDHFLEGLRKAGLPEKLPEPKA
jgi:adenylate cyclase